MFIDAGTPIDVMTGPYSGRFGVVSKIRIFQDHGRNLVDVIVFAELFNYQTGVFDAAALEPGQIKRRRLNAAQVERLMLDVLEVAA